MYRYALGTVGNTADAEDVAQATFTSALRAVRRGERPEKPENWLITIAHNECRQRFRRLGRRAVEVPLDDAVAAPGSAVADAAETAEEVDGVLGALAELPFNQRAALVLREVSGRSAADIAEFLDTSTAAVEMLVFRARQTIRTDLAGVRALALVPLPQSLLSFMGGSAVKTGGVIATLGGAGKVTAVVVAAALGTSGGSPKPEQQAAAELPAAPERAVEVRKNAPVRASTISRVAPRASRTRASQLRSATAPPVRPQTSPRAASAALVMLPPAPAPPPVRIPLPPVLSQPVAKPTLSLPTVPPLPLELPAVEVPAAEPLPDPEAPSLP